MLMCPFVPSIRQNERSDFVSIDAPTLDSVKSCLHLKRRPAACNLAILSLEVMNPLRQ
jgi:hypothetical protein